MLKESTNTKQKMALGKTFFASFHGLEVSEWGKEVVGDFSNKNEKEMFTKKVAHLGKSSLLLDDDDATSVLGGLFG